MSASSEAKSQAAKLKDEGNALFVKKLYREAHAKYGEAIAKDDQSAVYFANRAACSLNLKQYLDAAVDAERATKLDPLYSKAWARLATAHHMLGSHEKSVEYWQRALQALPVENLTSAELKQKEEWTKDMTTVKRKIQAMEQTPTPHIITSQNEAPWKRAAAIKEEIVQRGGSGPIQSSAWVILIAYEQFAQAMKWMKELRQDGNVVHGRTGALTRLSNAVVQDSRVFHIEDSNFIDLYNKQVMFETQRISAPTEGGTDYITSSIIERQRKDGWDIAREALGITIRGYIMRGFMSGKLQQNNYVAGEEFIQRALEILEWGHKGPWKDIPQETKGVIFSKTFMRGVRVLHMEAYMGAYLQDPETYPLRKLRDEATTLIQEVDGCLHEITPELIIKAGTGFINSFYMYPKGHALAMVGFYHVEMATKFEREPEAKKSHFRQAATAYTKAADMFLPDDEQRIWYLNVGLTNLWRCGTPIKDTLPLMEKIRLLTPDMKRIWEHSSIAKERDRVIKLAINAEEDIRHGLANGTYTMEDRIIPQGLSS